MKGQWTGGKGSSRRKENQDPKVRKQIEKNWEEFEKNRKQKLLRKETDGRDN